MTTFPTARIAAVAEKRLTQLGALTRRLQQQPQLVQHQGHVHGVAAQPLHPKQEGHGRLELSRQEQHLEVQEGLLAGREMGLSCWTRRRRGGDVSDEAGGSTAPRRKDKIIQDKNKLHLEPESWSSTRFRLFNCFLLRSEQQHPNDGRVELKLYHLA